jgi:bifunctional non-homologous end joining protein LigD
MRQPIFVGLREDKPARSVHREIAKPVPEKESSEPTNGQPAPTLSNLTKVYWPGEGITKGDLIDYYRTVAPLMLPHLRDRAQSLHRHPNGIDGPSFFQKDVSDHPPPSWVRTAVIESDSGSATQDIVCQDEPTLLYIANLGCIEINAWNSRIGKLDRPDYAIIDLDPQDLPFDRVVEAAQAVRRLLDRAGAESFCKTSGKRGLHVYVPLGARYTNDQARRFAELVANLVHARLPETTSVLRSPALRRGRIYLDFLQNRRGQTMAMPYSVRPVPGAWVSTPLKWSEIRRGLHAGKFTMGAVPRRLDRLGDLWKPVLGRGVDLMKIVEQLAK